MFSSIVANTITSSSKIQGINLIAFRKEVRSILLERIYYSTEEEYFIREVKFSRLLQVFGMQIYSLRFTVLGVFIFGVFFWFGYFTEMDINCVLCDNNINYKYKNIVSKCKRQLVFLSGASDLSFNKILNRSSKSLYCHIQLVGKLYKKKNGYVGHEFEVLHFRHTIMASILLKNTWAVIYVEMRQSWILE